MRAFESMLIAMLLAAAGVHAQETGARAGAWEAGFHVMDMSSVTSRGRSGSFLDVDDDVGYGVTGAYNLTNRFAVGVDAYWASPNYRATFVPDGPGLEQSISTSLDVAGIEGKAVFHFLEGDLTPFVEAGLGWVRIDSNIVDGPPITGCWWDPWWGYVCERFYSTYAETRTTYSAAVGARWDWAAGLAFRGSVGILEVDTPQNIEDATIDTVRIDVAWRF